MTRPRLVTLTLIVLAAAATRLIPHPPNMTSIAAVALFAGAHFEDRRMAFAVPLIALLFSDMVIGFHSSMPAVYLSFALVVCFGLLLRTRRQPALIAGAAVLSSILFFAVTNLSVWASSGMYAKTTAGLATCFVAALPFFRNSLTGDLAYTLLLFGGFALLQRRFTALRPAADIGGMQPA